MPNDKQKAVIRALKSHTEFWRGCEDIDSPSHYIDVEDTREYLMEDYDLKKVEGEEFATRVIDFLNYLRKLH